MSDRTTRNSQLFRKLVLLIFIELTLAAGMLYLFRIRPIYPAWFQNWYAVVSLAVLAGFGSRWMLNRRSLFIRLISAMAAYIIAIFVLGAGSGWKYGIGPLKFGSDRVDAEGLIQLGIGLYFFLLIAFAWRKPRRVEDQPLPVPSVEMEIPSREVSQPGNTGTRASILDLFKPKSKRTVKVGRRRSAGATNGNKPAAGAATPAKPRRSNPFRRKAKVRLAIVESHRCPYCLEPVSRVDPRGVVECDVCHTLHHKDCWDVTGVCQVPHLNSR